MNFSKEERMEITQRLLDWFAKNQRPLPWRKAYEPYEVWISEIMLQQTQVATMLPYFERWMKVLPDIKAVARAKEEDLIKLWEGLGYYSRARNIHKAAHILVEENGGKFPAELDEIAKLPGIGPYTAAAIASIAFEQDFPVVDGNVMRVLARLGDFRENVQTFKKEFWAEAGLLLPQGRARTFNQALMEFGALQCTPKNPACSTCPLQGLCKAAAAGTQEFLPNKGPSRSKVPIQVVIAVIAKNGKVFVQKRRDTGLMAGLWEFPGGQVEKAETLEEALHREIEEELDIQVKNVRFFMNIKHAYTKYTVDLHCFLADFDAGTVTLNAATESRWLEPEQLSQLAFPAANVKLINKLLSFTK